MARSYNRIYLHFVWATVYRKPLVTPDRERAIYRCIQNEAQKLGATVIALGGMPDHVHLAVHMPTSLSPSKLMQQVKGVSSQLGQSLLGPEEAFRWQHGYGVFSMSQAHLHNAIAYIRRQKEHHGSQDTWPEWEKTEEEEPDAETGKPGCEATPAGTASPSHV